ncbi:hypothetical protein JCM1841_005460 [Sporobolomyces salmonicolor]
MAPRPRCPVCRSKRWHRDALSGSIVCEEGHVLTGYVQETTESQEPSQHVQQTRRQRKNKQRKERVPANDYFHGDRGTFLVWQCMQLILREQLRVLIDEMGWPAELEAVTRDLWAMLVASSRVPPAPVDYERGEEPAGSYSGPRSGDRYIRSGRPKWGGRVKKEAKGEADDATDEDGAGSTTEQSGHASGGGSSDESSVSSYFSDADADDERPRDGSRSRRGTPTASAATSPAPSAPANPAPPEPNLYAPPKPRPPASGPPARNKDDPRAHPRMDYLLLVIYLACMTLRLPVFLSDIVHLAETYQILYLDAATHLPLEMQSHLTISNRKLLSPVTVPHLYSPVQTLAGANHAQVWLARLVLMYRDDWNVEFPEANMPLIVGRLCRVLALPPVAYLLIRRVLSLLPQPHSFHLPTSLSASDRRCRGQPRYSKGRARPAKSASVEEKGLPSGFRWLLYVGGQDWRSLLPELKVACAVIIVAKMLWRLEDEQGEASSASAKPLLEAYVSELPSSDRWLATVEAIASLEKPGDLSQLWNTEVVDMGGDDIDAYLDFFEGKILSEKKIPSRMADFSRFFPEPVSKPSSRSIPSASSYISQLDALIASLYALPSPTSADTTPPSSSSPASYSSHPTASSASDLPPPLSRLLVALCAHLLPIPESLPNSLSGPVPTHAAAGIAYLLPHLGYIEQLLAVRSVARQKPAAKAARAEEKKRNEQLRQQRARAAAERAGEEKKRRREVEKVVTAARRARKEGERTRKRDGAKEREREKEKERRGVTFKGRPSAKSDVWVESESEGDDEEGSTSGASTGAGSRGARGGGRAHAGEERS